MISIKGYGTGVNGNKCARNFCIAHVDKSVGTAGIKAAIEKVRHDMNIEGTHQVDLEITMTGQEYSMIAEDCIKTGQMEAWDLARRIMDGDADSYTLTDLISVFGTNSFPDIFRTPVETALKKDKKYQEELQTLHIGDQVITTEVGKGYVVFVGKEVVKVLCKGGNCYWYGKNSVKKTGKTDSYIATIIKSLD